jgi:hypothetical protein
VPPVLLKTVKKAIVIRYFSIILHIISYLRDLFKRHSLFLNCLDLKGFTYQEIQMLINRSKKPNILLLISFLAIASSKPGKAVEVNPEDHVLTIAMNANYGEILPSGDHVPKLSFYGRTDLNYGFLISEEGNRHSFSFNDPKDRTDFHSIKFFDFKEMDDLIFTALKNALSSNAIDRYRFAAREGIGGGKMDFGIKIMFMVKPGSLIFFDGKLYNPKDFGNYLWGAAMARLGFSLEEMLSGAHANAFFNGHKQNGGKRSWRGDDMENQDAIRDGFKSKLAKLSTKSACNESLGTKFAKIHLLGADIANVVFGRGWK